MSSLLFFYFSSSQADLRNDTTSKAIHNIFKNAIQLLQDKGLVFRKDGGFDNLYYVRELQLNFFPSELQLQMDSLLKNTYLLFKNQPLRRYIRGTIGPYLLQGSIF